MSERSDRETERECYGIGAVAAQTGLSPAAIRMWEKRYGAVTPHRTPTNRRLYGREDLERLSTMQQLTASGHAISQIAGLTTEQLRAMVGELSAELRTELAVAKSGPRRLLMIGPGTGLWERQLDLAGMELSVVEENLASLDAARLTHRADLVVVETDTLFAEASEQVREVMDACGALRVVIVYRFASRAVMARLEAMGDDVVILRGPLSAARLQRECLLQVKYLFPEFGDPLPAEAGPVPQKRFTAAQLARLATISSSVDCECPRHMAELLKNLCAFEAYSEACEDRNENDALVHGYLHRTTARVRRTMENALGELLKAEGIEL